MAAWEMGLADRPVDLIFTHANGFNGRTYLSLLAPLADQLHILVIDQRGHGRSTLPAEPEGRDDWYDLAGDLTSLLEVLDLNDVVLAGHSMGGTASVMAANAMAGRVKSLALFDPVILSPRVRANRHNTEMAHSPLVEGARRRRSSFPSHAAAMAAYTGRGAFRTWPAQMLADYVADGFAVGPDGEVHLTCKPAWEVSNFTSQAHNSWAALVDCPVPIDILQAEQASTLRCDGHEDELAGKAHFTRNVIAGTSHFLPMERPDRVRELLLTAAL